jgi:hypothetical protein
VRDKAKNNFSNHQMIIKKWFDNIFVGDKNFYVGYLVLKWDKSHEEKGKHTKCQKLWLGPFQVAKNVGSYTFILQNLEGIEESFPVNGLILKKYFS